MRCSFLVFLFLLSITIATAQNNNKVLRPAKWAQPIEGLKLKNMYKVDEGVYRAEQIDEKGFVELEKFGIKEVLNLRNFHNDEKEARNTNIMLHRVKMHAHDINNSEIITALRIIKNRKGPIAYHCKHGSDRTGVLTAMYRIVVQGWSREEAIDEMKNGDYGFHSIYFNIPHYVKNVNIDWIKQQVNK